MSLLSFEEFCEASMKDNVEFKKEAPNGHSYLKSIFIPKEKAEELIAQNKNDSNGWNKFKPMGKWLVVVGNNKWIDLDLDQWSL